MAGRRAWVLSGVVLLYSLLCFVILGARAIWEGRVSKRPGSKFWTEVEQARDRFWDLSRTPGSFTHAFFRLDDYRQLHYVTNNPSKSPSKSTSKRRNLVILLHGWPDSWILWLAVCHQIPAALTSESTLVALDLPGLGGSDGLYQCGATEMMEALVKFILGMREIYLRTEGDGSLDSEGKVLLVAHDWGALCGFKLAAEAPQLADRYILANSPLPELAINNITRQWLFARRMFTTWSHEPRKLRILRLALSTLLPIIGQIVKSSYVFVFNLPTPMIGLFGGLGSQWFLRYAHSLALGPKHRLLSQEAVIQMASSLGPSATACKTSTPDNQVYSLSVQNRAKHGFWTESTRFYREGLATQPWDKSLETVIALYNLRTRAGGSSSGGGLFEDGPKGALKARTTIVWGGRDPALDSRIMIDGIGDYLTRGSEVIKLPRVGHWVPVHGEGSRAMAQVVAWALEGEGDSVAERVQSVCPRAMLVVQK